MKSDKGCRAGVALLEAMVSVSLVGIGLLTSLRAVGFAATAQSRMEDRVEAMRLVEQQMATLCAQGPGAIQGEMSGRFSPPFEAYSWSAKSFAGGEETPFALVQLRVWRGEGENPRGRAPRQGGYALQTLVR